MESKKDRVIRSGRERYESFLQTSATDTSWAALGPLRVRFGCLAPKSRKKRPLVIACRKHKEANRQYFYALRGFLKPRLHPALYQIRSDGLERAQLEILKARSDGFTVVHSDLYRAFSRVCRPRLKRILRSHGVSSDLDWLCGMEEYAVVNSKKGFGGLPQGFSTSPILFAAYVDPIIRRMNRYYWTIAFADDLFIFVRSKRAAKDAIRYLKKCLDQHSGNPKLMLNDEDKEPKTVTPNEDLMALGRTFLANGSAEGLK